ncbi:MAG: glycoside hydrolase family 44 protein [Thermoflexales bacterium]|nr:glycoside hydrolase family 44 protein [Thermoflexales bacterium]
MANHLENLTRLVLATAITCSWLGTRAVGATPHADLVVYTDAPDTSWDDWSWDTTRDFSHADPVHSGDAAMAVTYTRAWGGLYLHAHALSLSGYDTLRFWLHGGSAGGQRLSVSLNFNGSTYGVTATAGVWQKIEIPLSVLGSPATVSDLVWQDGTGGTQPTFFIDDVAFVGSGTPAPTPAPGMGPALSVDAAADQHPISPYIYGMNYAGEAIADDVDLPVRRWGGNSTTRYNWQIDVHNTGSDWYFENIPDAPGTAEAFIAQDRRTGTKTIMTVPLIGWTPKRRLENHPYDCGFPKTAFTNQDDFDPWDENCGNGKWQGQALTGNDPLGTSKVITPSFVTDWVDRLVATHGTAANGGVLLYNLDNEPMLWNATHRDVHPTPTSYDEMRDRTYLYAAAVKAADPTAQTLGPVTWGWCAYLYSAADGCGPGTDRAAHGNVDFTPWYLAQMRAYEEAHGVRILDYLDLHYYPQASGVALSSAGSAATQALRLRSTRSLWDPTYIDESWISDTTDEPVQLIPRMKRWVADNYPGTKLAITEYNWGALDHINGALAQADVLGIFGREGLGLATLWDPPKATQPGALAFRMYRNYDGLGHAFGETSVRATSADQERLAVYAARRGSDSALTLMIINKTSQPLTSTLALANFQPGATAQVYHYSPANLSAIVQAADQSVAASGFTATFPANSITLIVIPATSEGAASVAISGPTVGLIDTAYTFTATLSPATLSLPITYTWLPGPLSGQGAPTATFLWHVAGYQAMTVTAQYDNASTSDAHTILIGRPSRVYLPLVLRQSTTS